ERVKQPAPFVGRRLPPGSLERGARSLDGAVDVGLAGHRGAAERLARGGLGQLPQLARGRLDALAVDEEPVLVSGRDGHSGGRYRLTGDPADGHNWIR